MRRTFLSAGIACLLLTLTAACQDPLKYENYSRIQENRSSRQEVSELLGEPCMKYGNQWLYERPDRHLCALIDFTEEGTVCRKQWMENDFWDDSDESGGGWFESLEPESPQE